MTSATSSEEYIRKVMMAKLQQKKMGQQMPAQAPQGQAPAQGQAPQFQQAPQEAPQPAK